MLPCYSKMLTTVLQKTLSHAADTVTAVASRTGSNTFHKMNADSFIDTRSSCLHLLNLFPSLLLCFLYHLCQNSLFSTMSGLQNRFNNVAETLSSTSQPEHATSDTSSHPAHASSQDAPSSGPAPDSSPITAVQTNSVKKLVALSQKVFVSLETPRATTPIKSRLTFAQKQSIEENRQEAI